MLAQLLEGMGQDRKRRGKDTSKAEKQERDLGVCMELGLRQGREEPGLICL
jgi:hypothetical protein